MDNPNEVDYDISKLTADIDPMIIEMIYAKQYEQDYVAADVIGWAYDKLAD